MPAKLGHRLFLMWWRKMYGEGVVQRSPWHELPEAERRAWNALAERLRGEGWCVPTPVNRGGSPEPQLRGRSEDAREGDDWGGSAL